MSDPYGDRLGAAKRRLEEAKKASSEVDIDQAENDERLEALEAKVSELASDLGVCFDEAADPPPGVTEADSAPLPAKTPDPVVSYLVTSEEFATGLREDRAYLSADGAESVPWDELLSGAEIAEIEAQLRRPVTAEPMNRGDIITVGVCAGLGALAVMLDDQIDWFIKDRVCDLHDPKSALGQSKLGHAMRQWDREGKNLAIDYSGKGIGGGKGVHRVRSAGHDLLRPFEAIEQIRSGQFQGHDWEEGVRIAVSSDCPRPGFSPYRQVPSVNEAILVWLKHLASDFTTDKSLPLPGATYIHDIPVHELRSIGAEAYKGGLNLRRVLISGMLPVATVEAGVRLSVHIRTWRETKSARLSLEREAKLHNMLLLTHGIVAAASAGKIALRWGAEGPVALRHLNPGVFLAVAGYTIPVLTTYVQRNDEGRRADRNDRELAAGWDQLLAHDGFMNAVRAFEDQPSRPLAL